MEQSHISTKVKKQECRSMYYMCIYIHIDLDDEDSFQRKWHCSITIQLTRTSQRENRSHMIRPSVYCWFIRRMYRPASTQVALIFVESADINGLGMSMGSYKDYPTNNGSCHLGDNDCSPQEPRRWPVTHPVQLRSMVLSVERKPRRCSQLKG